MKFLSYPALWLMVTISVGWEGTLSAQSSQPSSAPAGAPASKSELRSQATFILELDENHMKVQENWQIQNPTSGFVPAKDLVFSLGDGARRLTVDEDVVGFEANEAGTVISAKRALGPGSHGFAGAYLAPVHDGRLRFSRRFPVPIQAGRVIVEDIAGLDLKANIPLSRRTRDLNGLSFVIFDFNQVPADSLFEFQVTGLPSRNGWPRTIAFGLCGLALIWMLYALLNNPQRDQVHQTMGALSAEARREQLLKALELLEEDRQAGKIVDKQHDRRHASLMRELADVLREQDIVQRSSEPASSRSS
ncbi:MAG: hypothetical protein KTR25_16200 [Myxococcales bacterium]|nr:hypothetical protein [Myxococcales bacterium]